MKGISLTQERLIKFAAVVADVFNNSASLNRVHWLLPFQNALGKLESYHTDIAEYV